MIQHYDGQALFGRDGEEIGQIERTFVDDNGIVQYVAVKIGAVLAKHRLVPVEEIRSTEGGLQVPYDRDLVEGGPSVDVGDILTADGIDKVRSYYESTGQVREVEETPDQDRPGVGDRIAQVGEDLTERIKGALHRDRDHGDDTARGDAADDTAGSRPVADR